MEFAYQAKTHDGALIAGKIDAPSEDQAINILHRKDLVILSLESLAKPLFSRDLGALLSQPSKNDLVIFTRQIATLVDADVPLVEGLHALADLIEKETFRKVVAGITAAIEGGASLSLALSEHRKVFSAFYISLVKAGEASGKLHSTLLYLADYLERSAALSSKIKGALSYPAFILFAIVLVSTVVVTVVLPKLLVILKESGVQDLPFTTKVLIFTTDFINRFFVLILLLFLALVVVLVYYLKTPEGRDKWHNLKLKLPRFGQLIRGFYLARLSESLSTLIKAGVPILESLAITGDVVGNETYKKIIFEAQNNVQAGGTVSETFQKYPQYFPALVGSMLAIGEKTGRTDYMLDNITKFYKTETENSIQNLTQLIEPVLILILGVVVALLVSAILLPMYSLVGGG